MKATAGMPPARKAGTVRSDFEIEHKPEAPARDSEFDLLFTGGKLMATAQAITHNRLRTEQFGQVQQRRPARQNVGETERWLSAIGGGALAIFGLSQRSLPGIVLAGIGGSLVYRGLSGHC